MSETLPKCAEILLVEDNPSDINLTKEALKQRSFPCNINVVMDGVTALEYLRRQGKYAGAVSPDLILLDLNLPKRGGVEVLGEIKADGKLNHIPVVVLTTSDSEHDILTSYKLHASCFITKPVDIEQFLKIIRSIEDFWFSTVKLPPRQA